MTLSRLFVPLYAIFVFLAALYFYGILRAFPLIDADAAANYVSLLNAVNSGSFFSDAFKLKWFEGLGQPNLFYSGVFDPFNWIFLSGLADADAFRVSYALRVLGCWFLTYLAARELIGDRLLATTAGTLNAILCFLLGTPGGVPAWAGIHHMTQVSLFPGLMFAYLLMKRQPRLLSPAFGLFAVLLLFFLLSYPLNSIIGLVVFGGFATADLIAAPSNDRRASCFAYAKFVGLAALLLFLPWIGIYHAWSAVVANSARLVFNQELATMLLPGYEWPNFWRYGMPEMQVLVAVSLGILAYRRPFDPGTRTIFIALYGMVALLQLVTIIYAQGWFAGLFRKLPAISRIELYLTPFYAMAATIVLHHWWRLVTVARPGSMAWLLWFTGLLLAAAGATLILKPSLAIVAQMAAAFLLTASLLRWVLARMAAFDVLRRVTSPGVARITGAALAAVVIVGAIITPAFERWRDRPGEVQWPVGQQALCLERGPILCRDKPGITVAAAATPLIDFLGDKLNVEGLFQGRAEFLVAPLRPDEPNYGSSLHEMIRTHYANYEATGNGMVLMGLPFQGVPVASSYEQTQDTAYYLLWSRYVNRDRGVAPAVNITTLSTVHPKALALIGVRYLVASDKGPAVPPELTPVFRSKGYTIFEIPNANVASYAPQEIHAARDMAETLKLMREPGFDPAHQAVLSAYDAARTSTDGLAPLLRTSINIEGQTLHFTAESAGRRSLAVLPFRASQCWNVQWRGKKPELVTADLALLGVIFEGSVDLQLTWNAGYLNGARCLRDDAARIAEALAAAQAIRY